MRPLPAKMLRLQTQMQKLQSVQGPDGQSIPIPAPTEGMNTRDGVSSLKPTEARSLRNMLAERGKCVIRKGKTEHQTIDGASSVGSMFTHEGVSSNVILAAAAGEIYDVTGSPSALTSNSYNSDVWSMVQFNDTTIGVNGQDTPFAFDGSSVGASGLSGSGLTIANLRTVHVVGIRMWFTEVSSADVWYLAPNAITGALTKFQLSQETKGGYCVGVYEFRNYTVFIMSSGEILAYQGDPGTDFAIVSRYDAPKPVGYDPGFDVAGEPVIMTVSGPLPFEAIAAGISFDTTALNTWGKIAPSWASDFEASGSQAGWSGTFYSGLVILNIQLDSTASKQWVYNTRTKSWCYFDELNGFSFTESGGVLYFGAKDSGTVWAYMGGTDDGESIVATVRGGFIYPFQAQVNGQYTLARLNVEATGLVVGQIQVDVDYREAGIDAPEIPLSSSGSGPWDGPWDGPWGENGEPILRWSSVEGFGRSVAPVAQFSSQADDLAYYGIDLIASQAGVTG
jgi:hypothetical protein